ncbi:MAG: hypothetical protein PHV74_05880 [Dehalococcoidia bacterium]|nr:hypothetical protein [Dehalococcoidia bacterium]
MKSIKNLVGFLLFGFIFWLPVGIVLFAGNWAFGLLEDSGHGFLDMATPWENIRTGLGVVLWVFAFFFTGLILKKTYVGDFMSGVPVVGFFFRRTGEAMTPDKLRSLTPCLFLYSPTCISYGWLLSREGVKSNDEKTTIELINVYYPNVPTMVTGQVFAARKETVMKLGNPSKEIFDVLLYGLRTPAYMEYLPWEGEADQDFRERVERFGSL